MTQISKKSSFSLLRTNPRLTTNVKIVSAGDKVYLDSINADSVLANSKYKKFDVTGGMYSYDIYNFYNRDGKLPVNLAYKVFEKFSYATPKAQYSDQYDFEYCAGAYTKNSALYNEEFAMFAPLWVEKENLPEYFIILKLNGPVTINSKDSNTEDELNLINDDIINSTNFFKHYLKNSELVKTISLKENTSIGKYIRNHVNDSSFPEGSIYATIKKDEYSYINGISYNSGGFCSVADNFYDEFVLQDKIILEKDNNITNKFSQLGVVHPNILNLEFLFDVDGEYEMNRYMGFYVSEAQLDKFTVTKSFSNKSYSDGSIEVNSFLKYDRLIDVNNLVNRIPYVKDPNDNFYLINQSDAYEKRGHLHLKNIFSGDDDDNSYEINLPWSVKYNNVSYDKIYIGSNSYVTFGGGSTEYSGFSASNPNLPTIFISSADNSVQNVFADISDDDGDSMFVVRYEGYNSTSSNGDNSNIIWEITFYKNSSKIDIDIIHNEMLYDGYDGIGGMTDGVGNWILQNQLFVSDNVSFRVNEDLSITELLPRINKIKTKNSVINPVNFSNYEPYRTISVNTTNELGKSCFAFKVNSNVSETTQIRLLKVDIIADEINDDDVDLFGVRGNDNIPAGTAYYTTYSTKGNTYDIAKAISAAINNIEILAGEQIFRAIYQNDIVVVYAQNSTSYWDNLKWSIFSTGDVFPFTILNDNANIIDVHDYVLTYDSFKNDIGEMDVTLYLSGKLASSTFKGGSDTNNNRFIISSADVNQFFTNNTLDELFAKGLTYSKVKSVSSYLDEPLYDENGLIYAFNNFDKFATCVLEDDIKITYNKKIILYKNALPSIGYFSFLPIKDFDFDTFNLDYTKCEDSKIPELWDFCLSKISTQNFDSILQPESSNYEKCNLLTGLFENEFLSAKGFSKLVDSNLNEDYDQLQELAKLNQTISEHTQDTITNNEYDRLNENYLTTTALFSKVVPFVNKWVSDDLSTDVRNNNYRLNIDQSFGQFNFSPSFDYTKRDPRFFTHEWYLLQKYPTYYIEHKIKEDSYSYFENNINESSLYDVNSDYFNDYFTRRYVGTTPIKTDYKYSIFSGGNTQKFPECIFRGVKVRLKKRIENSDVNYNLKEKVVIPDNTLNGYKFSAVLAMNEDNELSTSIKFIKNNKFKSITCLIKASLGGFLQTDFIDRNLLYSINHKVISNNNVLSYDDRLLQGRIYKMVNNSDGTFTVFAKGLSSSNLPSFKSELTLNEQSSYNDIVFEHNGTTIRFGEISKVIDNNSFICSELKCNYNNIEYNIVGFDIEKYLEDPIEYLYIDGLPNILAMYAFVAAIKDDMKYENGGYNGYHHIINEISFANIANLINLGDPKIQYIEILENGTTENGKFLIELVKHDVEYSTTYLGNNVIVPNADVSELNTFDIIGYELKINDRTSVKPIYRNQFYFNPKVYDVVSFCDDSDLPELYKMNTKFYVNGNNFSIKNLFFNKVNTQNNQTLLKLTNLNQYPLIEQYTLSKKDFNVFKSNWDTNYYNEFTTERKSTEIIGTKEQLEQRSFFGSKLLTLPNDITIDYIKENPINNLDNNTGISYNDTKFNVTMQLNISILLQNYFLNIEPFYKLFSNYINTNFSFGNNNLEDDIRRYIELNVKERYIIKDIIVWKKSLTSLEADQELFRLDLTTTEKISEGFKQITNFTNEKIDAFNNKLTYNKQLDESEQFSLTIKLKKI